MAYIVGIDRNQTRMITASLDSLIDEDNSVRVTCFISLIVYRYLEQKLDNKYTIDQIIPTLQEMDFMKYEGKGYQPIYTRTELTDVLHEVFGFCTSKQIVPIGKMRNIISQTKK